MRRYDAKLNTREDAIFTGRALNFDQRHLMQNSCFVDWILCCPCTVIYKIGQSMHDVRASYDRRVTQASAIL